MPRDHSSESIRFIKLLAGGQNPATGAHFPETDALWDEKIQHKIFELLDLMSAVDESAAITAKTKLPQKAESSWAPVEDNQLRAQYQQGDNIAAIAQVHRRSHGAIQSRLIKHGLINAPAEPESKVPKQEIIPAVTSTNLPSVEISGVDIVSLSKRADPDFLNLLIGAEYADVDSVWVITAIDQKTITLTDSETGELRTRLLEAISLGSVYLNDHGTAIRIKKEIEETLTKTERALISAREILQRHDFFPSDLGSDIRILKLATHIKNHELGAVLESKEWQEFHEIVTELEKLSVMRPASRLAHAMLERKEILSKGRKDLFCRVTVAYLFRHIGKPLIALEICEAIDQPPSNRFGSNSSLAVLSTLRASTFADLAELENDPDKRHDLLKKARISVDRANAISGEKNEHCMRVYQRLKKLESDDVGKG
jgi:hypothetical protein